MLMSEKSNIEWTDATWNPVTGCTQVSPGCDHCYALTFADVFEEFLIILMNKVSI